MLSDEDILERGGSQEDIDAYAHDVGGACGAVYGGRCDHCGKVGSMKDTETVTLDETLDNHAKVYAKTTMQFITKEITEEERDKEWHHSDLKTKKALIKLFEQAVESAKPEKLNDELNYSAYGEGHDAGISEYERVLLQAFSNSRVQHINRGAGFTHSDSNDCACFSLDAKEDLL